MGWGQRLRQCTQSPAVDLVTPKSAPSLYHTTAEAEVRLSSQSGVTWAWSQILLQLNLQMRPQPGQHLAFSLWKTLKWGEPGISGSESLDREKQQALRQRSWSDHLPSQAVGTLYTQDVTKVEQCGVGWCSQPNSKASDSLTPPYS